MTAFVVVDPRAGHTKKEWPGIRAALALFYPHMTVTFARRPSEAAGLVRDTLREGRLEIVAVGDDGTLNAAVNGFFDASGPVSPDAVLGFIASGGDFARSFGIAPGFPAAIAHLKHAHMRRIDVGRLSCLSQSGEPLVRYFANAASFGLSGHAIPQERISRIFWRPRRIRLVADNGFDEIVNMRSVAVANGRYSGGGICIAPAAEPDDGQFEIVIMGASEPERARGPQVLRASRLVAAALADRKGPVPIETDGESAGVLPASFEILPNALNLRC